MNKSPLGNVFSDFNFLLKNFGLIFLLVILVESSRKFILKLNGVPYFVLDNEPLVTTLSYGVVFIGIIFGVFFYYIGILYLDKPKTIKLDNKLDILFVRFFSFYFSIICILLIINTFIFNPDIKKSLYINSTFKVEFGENINKIYYLKENTPFLYCKRSLFSDNCFTEVKKQ
ncbi:MAG: hypothetical protein NWP80_02080 [Candidatus Gracilibacteria bacterium]|nr:hypothetical protein [Candidatus Gracilibacteria bacterium]